MRLTFAQTLTQLAAQDQRICLLTADLGYMALEGFAEAHPQRFLNVGVAEQNMLGVATGMAEAGFIPFVYSITTFATLRAYEFIRNGPVLHGLPVRIIGVGGGFEYGHAGLTHHGLEDLAVTRAQPGLTVIAPADAAQTHEALCQSWNLPQPIYYRLGKEEKVKIPGLEGRFALGRLEVLHSGSDLCLLSMGAVTSEAEAAVSALQSQGIQATLGIVSSFNPGPTAETLQLLTRFSCVMTVEEHYLAGGLASWVSEIVAQHGLACRVVPCAVGKAGGASGNQKYLRGVHGLTCETLQAKARECLKR